MTNHDQQFVSDVLIEDGLIKQIARQNKVRHCVFCYQKSSVIRLHSVSQPGSLGNQGTVCSTTAWPPAPARVNNSAYAYA